jgi:hypothetical protein
LGLRSPLITLALIVLIPLAVGIGEIEVLWVQRLSVTGEVRDGHTGAPIPDARVVLLLHEQQAERFVPLARAAVKSNQVSAVSPPGTATTDAAGQFRATALERFEQRYWTVFGLHWRRPPRTAPPGFAHLVAMHPDYRLGEVHLEQSLWASPTDPLSYQAAAPPLELLPE